MWRCLLLVLGLVVIGGADPVWAQQPTDSIRAKALRDFHGADLTGKDGPLHRAALDLLVLYHSYRAGKGNGEALSPELAGLRVSDGHVTIDAIAADRPEALRADLEQLGLKRAAVAGRIVSGQLPIDQIPAAAQLETLRGLTGARMQTNRGPSGPLRPKGTESVERPDSSVASDETGPSDGGMCGGLLMVLGPALVLLRDDR